jgi:PTH1 family peptidyl-tRNA hydrolase
MLLLVGLGNIGDQYKNNRHNLGFMLIDYLADYYCASNFKSKFNGLIADVTIKGHKILLFKPSTYMNNSGRAVGAVANFYQIDLDDIIVFHDELDLSLAKVRVKRGGGSGGHNGLKSIDNHLGKDYLRVRIGIDHPGDKDLVTNYVLHNFSSSEQKIINSLLELICVNIDCLIDKNDDLFMNKLV